MSFSHKIRKGWYLYIPIQEGSPNETFMWVEIKDYWITISRKHNDPPIITLNIGMTSIKLAEPNYTRSYNNSIELEATGFQKSPKIRLSTNNRFDILAFCKAFIDGAESWREFTQINEMQSNFSIDCIDYTKSVIGNEISISLDDQFMYICREMNQIQKIPYQLIQSCTPMCYDEHQGLKVKMTIDSNDFIMKCKNNNEMIEFVTKIQYHLAKQYSTMPNQAVPNTYQMSQGFVPQNHLMNQITPPNAFMLHQFSSIVNTNQQSISFSPPPATGSPIFQFMNNADFYKTQSASSSPKDSNLKPEKSTEINNVEKSLLIEENQEVKPEINEQPEPVKESKEESTITEPSTENIENDKIESHEIEINEEEDHYVDPFDEEEFY